MIKSCKARPRLGRPQILRTVSKSKTWATIKSWTLATPPRVSKTASNLWLRHTSKALGTSSPNPLSSKTISYKTGLYYHMKAASEIVSVFKKSYSQGWLPNHSETTQPITRLTAITIRPEAWTAIVLTKKYWHGGKEYAHTLARENLPDSKLFLATNCS